MAKSTFFTGQPVFAQLCKYLDRDEVLKISTESGGERYRKSFDAWMHLLSMLHAVIGANEGVPGDIRFTSAVTHDSFMLKPANFDDGKSSRSSNNLNRTFRCATSMA